MSENNDKLAALQGRIEKDSKEPSVMDGWFHFDKTLLKRDESGRILYPDFWEFFYTNPTPKMVAGFSSVNENNFAAVIRATRDIFRSCIKIVNSNDETEIDSANINDGDRITFLLLLRSLYIPEDDITWKTICDKCMKHTDAFLSVDNIKNNYLSKKLLDGFDGRRFSVSMFGESAEIHVPTIKNMLKVYDKISDTYSELSKKGKADESNDVYLQDGFKLLSPYLFVTGSESMAEIKMRYTGLAKNDNLMKLYTDFANKAKLSIEETVTCECTECGTEGERRLMFPDGIIKSVFSTYSNEYF